MTRRDFILISETLRATRPDRETSNLPLGRHNDRTMQWEKICLRMADALSTTCPRFDRERFLKACGMES